MVILERRYGPRRLRDDDDDDKPGEYLEHYHQATWFTYVVPLDDLTPAHRKLKLAIAI